VGYGCAASNGGKGNLAKAERGLLDNSSFYER